ncbi:MAG: serine hydrolase domain-containing protein [Desulfobacterales bacterium]
MRAAILIFCAAMLAACAIHTPAADHASQFQTETDRVRVKFGFPGMTAAYVLEDGTVGTAASGLADVEASMPMTDNTRMLSASIGKSFVGALSISLAIEGRLSLDEPVSRWIGTFDWFQRLPNHESITLRHLLTHSAGILDHVHMDTFAEAFSKAWQETGNPFPPERLVEFVLDEPALFPAGNGWAYSDTGYILAGLIIEAVIKRPCFDVIKERFLLPLRLLDTSSADHRDLKRLAPGYMRPDNTFRFPVKTLDTAKRLHWHPAVEWTGGGLVSTSRDLARWGAALFCGRVMAGDYLSELLSAVPVDPDSTEVTYGAGVAIYSRGSFGPVYGHAGWIPGYVSSLRHYPKYGVTIAFQINTDIGIIDSDDNVLKSIENRLIQVFIEKNT